MPIYKGTKLTAYVTSLAFILVTIYTALYAMPPSALVLPFSEQTERIGSIFWPQGWAFFTKSPRTPELVAMQISASSATTDEADNLELRPLQYGPNVQIRWWFGADRTSRIQEFEYELLNRLTSHIEWFECEGRVDLTCFDEYVETGTEDIPVVNSFPRASLCGKLLLVRLGVTAWAYANANFSDSLTIDKIKVLNVHCTG